MQTSSHKPVRLIIIGAGARGQTYSNYAAENPDQAQVVAIAEPREYYRQKMAAAHTVDDKNAVPTWEELAGREKFADAVIICTPDALHAAPAIAFANLGYAILLEKPMSPNEEDCRRIVAAVHANQNVFAVCHVLRYTSFTTKLKELAASGLIGDLVSVQHLEPVGFWHQAHSFVRGNWRNTRESSFMLMSKSCHDMDWLGYIVGRKCLKVSSFGSLTHFRKEAKPKAAGDVLRCLDCAYDAECPYSAVKLYMGMFKKNQLTWPLDMLTPDLTESGVTQALREGPYGRCVYECDNDVVDHQVVNMLYEGNVTVSFTMTAFNEGSGRQTILFGTRGELRTTDSEHITHYDFLTRTTRVIDTTQSDEVKSGHGGGDYGLMKAFIGACLSGDSSLILSGADATLETHLATFAAEKARLSSSVVEVK